MSALYPRPVESLDDYYPDHTIVHHTPLLRAKNSKGGFKYWQGFVVKSGDKYYTSTVSYRDTKSGISNPVVSAPKERFSKNVGRSNETTPQEQATSEIESLADTKRDQAYYAEGEKPKNPPVLPMLAHSYDKRSHNIEYPAFIQPKLDGTRMLTDGVTAWSRRGKDYIPEVVDHFMLKDRKYQVRYRDKVLDILLDGELMLDHNLYSFQESISAIKKFRKETSPLLQFHVYDLIAFNQDGVLIDLSFRERYNILRTNFFGRENANHAFEWKYEGTTNDNIYLVQTEFVASEEVMKSYHGIFIGKGFEGTMIRNAEGLYKIKDRTVDLQKYKDFLDDEYEIVDVIEGEGKEKGLAVFVCKAPDCTDDDPTFKVRPQGTYEARAEMWKNRLTLIGKMLTVKYQNLSDSNKPRFPVGIGIRDYE